VLVLTASKSQIDMSQAHKLGCNLYLTKPTNFEGFLELAGLIKGLLP
jgi:DNA-binding response OmpR family regulator